MSSMFGVLATVLILIKQCTSQSTIEWLSDYDYYSFKTSFINLDYNKDGLVTINEAKLGILSILDAEYLATQETDSNGEFSQEVYSKYHTYQPSKYNCVPSLISMDFVDCLIMSVRHSTNTKEDAILDFDHVLKLYFGECDDISPMRGDEEETSCSRLVREGGDICSADDQIYCKLSCFKCTHDGSMLFESTAAALSDADTEKLQEILSERMYARSEITALSGEHNQRIHERKMGQHSDYKTELKADAANKAGRIGAGHICPLKAKMKHINRNRFVFMADPHIEPWYNPDGKSYVTRFEGASVSNMFQCRDNSGKLLDSKTECTLTGFSDPPLALFESALHAWNMYARRPEESVLFFLGDVQAHNFVLDEHNDEAVEALMYSLINSMLYYFEPDSIFVTAGNNDGPHNSVFTNNGDAKMTKAWAESIVNAGIVNNVQMPHGKYLIYDEYYDTVKLFRKTGYYMKPLSKIKDNYFVIVLNTNLGALNPTQQLALQLDLEFVASLDGGKVAILGHHPSVLENMIPAKYLHADDAEENEDDIILGLFSGHIHYFAPTDQRGFTTLPAMTQYAPYSAFAMSDIQEFKTTTSDKTQTRIKLSNDNLLMYVSPDHQLLDSHCWQ